MRLTLAFVSMIAAFLAGATASEAADYTIDPTHSHVLFTIDHLGFAKMVGLFSDFSGSISFDADNVPATKLNVAIKTETVCKPNLRHAIRILRVQIGSTSPSSPR